MEYKIVSSNIRFDNPSDGKHQWKYRKNILAKIVNDFSPHLLGTQEGKKKQIYDLLNCLDLEIADKHRTWIHERMYPCIFYNSSEIEVYESGDIWLSETPEVPASFSFNSAFPRLCTWMKGNFKSSRQDFMFINTHLDHSDEGPRVSQINVLINEIDKINEKKVPIILSGDFNDSPQSEVRKKILKDWNSLYDPWPLYHTKEEDSHHKFGIPCKYGSRIDWILLDQQFQPKNIEFDKRSVEGIFPSDHFPLKVIFEISS